MSLSDNLTVTNVLIAFSNANRASIPAEIAALLDNGDTTGALRAILKLPDFDFSDFANAPGAVVCALRAVEADDLLSIFEGGAFKCGSLSLNDVLLQLGWTVWGDIRSSKGAIVSLPSGVYVAISGDAWDIVDLFEDGPQGDGWYSVEADGEINEKGWFFEE